ncbi:MAG TPA: 1,6-anhydro-N-acetylmuramyl-L-alanine amidase AmpD [Woeseiaceae bacterium]
MPHKFSIDRATGLLRPAEYIASPNRDPRPAGEDPSMIVIHGISLPPGEFGGEHITSLFTNTLDFDAHPYFREIRGLEVSAHVLIRRDGSVIQYVPFNERAWHAGESRFRGRHRCNDFSIGIELEGEDQTPYEQRQYAVLAGIIQAICKAYPAISARECAAHSDIAPGRKTDPGPAFDWLRLYDSLESGSRRT